MRGARRPLLCGQNGKGEELRAAKAAAAKVAERRVEKEWLEAAKRRGREDPWRGLERPADGQPGPKDKGKDNGKGKGKGKGKSSGPPRAAAEPGGDAAASKLAKANAQLTKDLAEAKVLLQKATTPAEEIYGGA